MPKDPEELESEITSEADIHSFIVRVWREEPASEEGQEIWRGHITPIPIGERFYFSSIDDISKLITSILKGNE